MHSKQAYRVLVEVVLDVKTKHAGTMCTCRQLHTGYYEPSTQLQTLELTLKPLSLI